MAMSLKEFNYSTYWYSIRFMAFLITPIAFYLIPYSWFEGTSTIFPFNNIFGAECPGCGTTRAIHSLIHFNFAKAFDLNRMIVVVFPLMGYIWIKTIVGYLYEAKGSIKYLKKISNMEHRLKI